MPKRSRSKNKRKPKIVKSPIDRDSSIIEPTKIDIDEKVAFNFSRLCKNHATFSYKSRPQQYFLKLIERFCDVCNMSRIDMIVKNGRALGCHEIDFDDDAVKENSFGLGPEIDDDAWQFQLTSNAHGRVHGYFVGNIFYVVWLDPEHKLYE